MIRRPPRSTHCISSAASDVYKRQEYMGVITDIPYGNLVDWQGGTDEVNCLMESITKICNNETVIAICMNKNQKINNKRFKRLEKQIVGKRKFEIYKLAEQRCIPKLNVCLTRIILKS
eukprot:TRINITY_DN31717_c0_g1_i1.p2 TRINITY_DN31717_c0_g1~~TRINITY_DN31717_c0_g1_i1.p2  ORF type:complete len:118 (-),score=25.68 TRINITY_DN31717_c0_g1_i1:30-383(-)